MANGRLSNCAAGIAGARPHSLRRVVAIACALLLVATGIAHDRVTAAAAVSEGDYISAASAPDPTLLQQVLMPSPLSSDLRLAIADLSSYPDLVAGMTASSTTPEQRAEAMAWAREVSALPTLHEIATPAVIRLLTLVQTGSTRLAADPAWQAEALSQPTLALTQWVNSVLTPAIESCGPLPGPCDVVVHWITGSAIPWLTNGPGQVLKGALEIVGSIAAVVAVIIALPAELTVAAVIALVAAVLIAIAVIIDGIESIVRYLESFPSPPVGANNCSYSIYFALGPSQPPPYPTGYSLPSGFVTAPGCWQFPATNLLYATITDVTTGVVAHCAPQGGGPNGGCEGTPLLVAPTDDIMVQFRYAYVGLNTAVVSSGSCEGTAYAFQNTYQNGHVGIAC